MGNIAQLRLMDAEGRPDPSRPILRESKNSLPVLWFSLFEPTDATTLPMELSQGEPLQVPSLTAPTATALARWQDRSPLLHSWLPPVLHAELARWSALLATISSARVALDPAELALMLDASELAGWLDEATSAFSRPTDDNLAVLFDVTGLDFNAEARKLEGFEPTVVAGALMGYAPGR